MNKRLLVGLLVLTAFMQMSVFTWAAEDGAALYKSKCAMCHAPDGAGKEGKVPALKGTSLSEKQIADVLEKGEANKKAPHNAAFKGLTPDQAKAIATYVKGLK